MQPESSDAQTPPPGWQFTPGGKSASPEPPQGAAPVEPPTPTDTQPAGSVSWTASEFISHQKNGQWYLLLAVAGLLVSGIVYALTRDFISSGMVLFVVVMLGVVAGRQPRTLQYQVDGQGIRIGEKEYPYEAFKSFTVIDEGALNSITLLPMKRFMPAITLYYDPADEEHILGVLDDYLPSEEGQKDIVDRFMGRIRF